MSLTIKNEEVRQEALTALSNMNTIVRNDMLVRGAYITDEIVNPELAERGAICGGRQACAVGSLWLAGGVKPKLTERGHPSHRYTTVDLPGVDPDGHTGAPRAAYLSRKPGLRLAYNALNEAADRYCERNGLDLDSHYSPSGESWTVLDERFGSMERLFEATIDGCYEGDDAVLDLAELPKIIKSAREAIKRA